MNGFNVRRLSSKSSKHEVTEATPLAPSQQAAMARCGSVRALNQNHAHNLDSWFAQDNSEQQPCSSKD